MEDGVFRPDRTEKPTARASVNIQVTGELADRLKAVAARHNMPVNRLGVQAIRFAFDNMEG